MEPSVFFDGQSSRRRLVTLVFADKLEIAEVETPAPIALWPYHAIRRADSSEGTLRLACVTGPALARLEIRDPGLQADITRRCPSLDGWGSVASVPIWRIAAASLAAGIAILGMIWFGVPLAANRVAAAVPFAWEKPLGEALDPRVRRLFDGNCERPAGEAALRKLVGRLETVAGLPVSTNPLVLKSNVPNAFALPGGRVYVLSQLLTLSHSPDELAGVLAHEFGHMAHRDGLRRLLRDGGTSFLFGLMFGDVTGAGAVFIVGSTVLSASYSRADEEAADNFSIWMMQSLGRPTAPTGDLLDRSFWRGEGLVPSLLRDHPLTPERKLKLQAANRPTTGPDLLEPSEWQDLQHICE